MSCPYFREGYFGICVAPDAVHVPTIAEMETLCFRKGYRACPNLAGDTYIAGSGEKLPRPPRGRVFTGKSVR